MNVVFVKDEKVRLHKCHVCGNIDAWGPTWIYRYVLFGKGYAGWEENFNACSDECWNQVKDLDQPELRKIYKKNK